MRRQSIDAVDLFHGHVGAINVVAKGLLNAAKLIEDGRYNRWRDERYAGWNEGIGKEIADLDLAGIADLAIARDLDPKPRSGRQERYENLLNRLS